MKFIVLLPFFLFFLWFLKEIIFFIKDEFNHRRRMKNIKSWTEFNEQLIKWSMEIEDDNTRMLFMRVVGSEFIGIPDKDKLVMDLESEKVKIAQKWGKHIPSLLREVREKRLNEIGI